MTLRSVVRLIAVFAPICLIWAAIPLSAAPIGSYQQTCGRISQQAGVLIAFCTDLAGVQQATAIGDIGQCRGDIFNADGKLFCARGTEPPHGAYERSCDRVAVDGDDLRAICRAAAGFMVAAKLSGFRRCMGPIDNVDGMLVCPSSGNPRGSYETSCAVTGLSATRIDAICRTAGGGQQPASLVDFAGCRRDIANDDGRLVCRP